MADTGFVIDGRRYEVPALDTFTMDEAEVLYEACGLTLEDFVGGDDEREHKLKHPGFIRALLHIAYQRGNPDVRKQDVSKLIGQVRILSALEDIAGAADDEEGDAGPPVLTTEPEPSSPKSSGGSSESSGTGSTSGSDVPDDDQPPTGRTRSGTSLTSVPTVLAG